MPDLPTLALFSLAALALLVIPGPAVLYIVTRSIDQGRAAGLASVLGVGLGSSVHITAAALGLSALLLSSALAFRAVQYAGAAYLLFIGVRTLLDSGGGTHEVTLKRQRLARIFADGVLVNILNPKTALFFLAFLPQFVVVSRGAVTLQILSLGTAFIVLALVSDGTYALLAARAGGTLRRHPGFLRARRFITGGIFLLLGTGAALSGAGLAGV